MLSQQNNRHSILFLNQKSWLQSKPSSLHDEVEDDTISDDEVVLVDISTTQLWQYHRQEHILSLLVEEVLLRQTILRMRRKDETLLSTQSLPMVDEEVEQSDRTTTPIWMEDLVEVVDMRKLHKELVVNDPLDEIRMEMVMRQEVEEELVQLDERELEQWTWTQKRVMEVSDWATLFLDLQHFTQEVEQEEDEEVDLVVLLQEEMDEVEMVRTIVVQQTQLLVLRIQEAEVVDDLFLDLLLQEEAELLSYRMQLMEAME